MAKFPPWETSASPRKPALLPVIAENIPQRLKDANRWVVWRAEIRDDGKISKPPYQARRPDKLASTANSAHFSDFETAINTCRTNPDIAGIGFVVLAGDGLVFVDMDECVHAGEISDEAQDAINAFCTYAELSPSGTGVRIIGIGSIPNDFTNKNLHREMYSGGGNRYLTITGQVLDSLDTIEDCQDAIDHYFPIWNSRKNGNGRAWGDPIPVQMAQSVDLSRLSEFTLQVIHGEYGSYEGDRSKALLGVCMDMLRAGYSHAEILRVSAHPDYAISQAALERRRGDMESAAQWVASYTLTEAQRRVDAEPKATFAIQAKAVDAEPEPEQEEQRETIEFPPGLVGEIATEILANAIRPQPSFAVGGALMAVSVASQNYYRSGYMGGSLNLYMVQVGGTASGKDGPRQAMRSLLRQASLGNLAPEAVASGAALLRSLSANSTLCYMPDEFGLLLQCALSDKGAAYLRDLVAEMMRLYSMGTSVYGGKRYANEDDNIAEIVNPYVSLMASTTPGELGAALSQAQIDNGFLNRILYIEADHEKPPKNRESKPGYSQRVSDRLAGLSAHAGGIPATVYRPRIIPFQKDAAAALDAFDDWCDDQVDGQFGALWNRAHENAIRVAGVVALGMLAEAIVSREIAEWSIRFVRGCVERMVGHLEREMVESQIDADSKRALRYIRDAKAYASDHQFGELCAAGVMPHGKLTKLLKMPAKRVSELVDYLVDTKQVEKGTVNQDDKQRPTTVFRVLE